jgi:hypothetical protein
VRAQQRISTCGGGAAVCIAAQGLAGHGARTACATWGVFPDTAGANPQAAADTTTATCLVRAAAGLTGARLCTWCTSSGAVLHTACYTRLSCGLTAASMCCCRPLRRDGWASLGWQAGGLPWWQRKHMLMLRWSSTLAAASLPQPPAHVKWGCSQEDGCDVSKCLQASKMQGPVISKP